VTLEATDTVRVELAEVLRKKGFLLGRLTRDQFLEALRGVDDLGVLVHDTDVDALEQAAALAADHNLRVFDALVVHRALSRDVTLLTTDARLCRATTGLISTELLRGIDAS
jgi:predicted nucleic acid-binding protein